LRITLLTGQLSVGQGTFALKILTRRSQGLSGLSSNFLSYLVFNIMSSYLFTSKRPLHRYQRAALFFLLLV
jgi:hypothetical protein